LFIILSVYIRICYVLVDSGGIEPPLFSTRAQPSFL